MMMSASVTRLAATTPVKLKWPIIVGIGIAHLGALFAPWTFTWNAFWIFFWLQLATGLLGITVCYHRLLTHRSFQVPKVVEYLLTVCGVLALQGGPIKWVATHRIHHAFSDRPSDPHSPNRGFWWAHIGWLFVWDDAIDDPKQYTSYAQDIARVPFYRFLERSHAWLTVLLGVVLFAWGGLPYLVWGLFTRLVFVYHCTWLVNSAAHLWGYQAYDTNEGSRNNWWVALMSYGEGWHNNHHAYLFSAAHGLRWWEVDLTYFTIRLLAALGLAKNLRKPQGNPARLPDPAPRMPSLDLTPPRLILSRPSLTV